MATKDGKKTGGRQKGTKNKVNSEICQIIEESGKDRPAKVLFDEMHAEGTEPSVKRKIAEILMPYTERRMPQQTEITGEGGAPLAIRITEDDENI